MIATERWCREAKRSQEGSTEELLRVSQEFLRAPSIESWERLKILADRMGDKEVPNKALSDLFSRSGNLPRSAIPLLWKVSLDKGRLPDIPFKQAFSLPRGVSLYLKYSIYVEAYAVTDPPSHEGGLTHHLQVTGAVDPKTGRRTHDLSPGEPRSWMTVPLGNLIKRWKKYGYKPAPDNDGALQWEKTYAPGERLPADLKAILSDWVIEGRHPVLETWQPYVESIILEIPGKPRQEFTHIPGSADPIWWRWVQEA